MPRVRIELECYLEVSLSLVAGTVGDRSYELSKRYFETFVIWGKMVLKINQNVKSIAPGVPEGRPTSVQWGALQTFRTTGRKKNTRHTRNQLWPPLAKDACLRRARRTRWRRSVESSILLLKCFALVCPAGAAMHLHSRAPV